jgi:hypothetical protein
MGMWWHGRGPQHGGGGACIAQALAQAWAWAWQWTSRARRPHRSSVMAVDAQWPIFACLSSRFAAQGSSSAALDVPPKTAAGRAFAALLAKR